MANKHFKSLKEAYERASNYKIENETKKMSKNTLAHYFESGIETIGQLQHIIDSILFAIRDSDVTLEEIKRYIEENSQYMIVYPRYEELKK